MLYFKIIDIFERIDVNKASESKECNICHYWHFLNKGFKFQPIACNRCHDLLKMFMSLSDIAILNITGSNYRCIISGINKNESLNLLQYQFDQKKRDTIKHKNLLSHMKMAKEILTFDNIEAERKKF